MTMTAPSRSPITSPVSDPNTEEARLLHRWTGGEVVAIRKLIEIFLPRILARVRLRLGAKLREKAESGDYVNMTVIRVMGSAPRMAGISVDDFEALLNRIVENVLRDAADGLNANKRDGNRERSLPSDGEIALDPPAIKTTRTPSSIASSNEQVDLIRFSLQLLKPIDQEIIRLMRFNGLEAHDAAAILHIKSNTASQRFKRALQRLEKIAICLRIGDINQALKYADS